MMIRDGQKQKAAAAATAADFSIRTQPRTDSQSTIFCLTKSPYIVVNDYAHSRFSIN